MPFLVIEGTFHLCGRSPKGDPTGFEPDGDSCQFKPADPLLLEQLKRVGDPYRLTSIGSKQLRFEGIDALSCTSGAPTNRSRWPTPHAVNAKARPATRSAPRRDCGRPRRSPGQQAAKSSRRSGLPFRSSTSAQVSYRKVRLENNHFPSHLTSSSR